MEHFQKGMNRKWQRHYRETKMTWSVIAMLFGLLVLFPLVVFWPQYYSPVVFNSRMMYHFIIDIEDYFTCSNDYQGFVVEEPSTDISLLSIYVFNITNPADVFQRGYKPHVSETGPYGYSKKTYKYDVYFDPVDSLYVSFKEYSLLDAVVDPYPCEKMFFRMDRDYAKTSDPCIGGSCYCKNHNDTVTIVNALFLKTIWDESPHLLMGYLSQSVFAKVLSLMENDFVDAVRSHLVPYAFQEIYLFRLQMQSGVLLQTAFNNVSSIYNSSTLASKVMMNPSKANLPSSCGLSLYGISSCPLTMYSAKSIVSYSYSRSVNVSLCDFPSIEPLLNASNEYSFLNLEYGLPRWLALTNYFNYYDFNLQSGYTMVSSAEMANIFVNYTEYLGSYSFGSNMTYYERMGSKIIVQTICYYLVNSYLDPFSSKLTSLVYDEFRYTSNQVVCAPLGEKCIWQWGYLASLGANFTLSTSTVFSLIDLGSKVNSNPNNLYYDGNSGGIYNSFMFCSRYGTMSYNPDDALCFATDLSYTYDDALVVQPAGLWGVDAGVSGVNRTNLLLRYKQQSDSVRQNYFQLQCNISLLVHEYYRKNTTFHDEFVIKYLNNHVTSLNHTFSVGKWNEIGWAQWGGGYITNALLGVLTTYQIVRNGMWYFGTESYYQEYLEFSSWAIRMGYPMNIITDVFESRDVLYALAEKNETGVEFRRHLIYSATTFIGDGTYFVNGVGKVGDVTFTSEFTRANFSCVGNFSSACSIINIKFNSSSAGCDYIQSLYTSCVLAGFRGNKWLTNCAGFETSMTSPTSGIQCDTTSVYGEKHPFAKSRGNVLYNMLYSMTIDLKLKDGLWCSTSSTCQFNLGGMFATTSVRQLLFDGFSEPSILKYINNRYESHGIKILCRENQYDYCGVEVLSCNDKGITLYLPNGNTKNFTFGITPNEEYFAPYFVITAMGEMVWPFASDNTTATYAAFVMLNETVYKIPNPHFAMYPAWTSTDVDFIKFYQCKKRTLGGTFLDFKDCVDTLHTGRDNYLNTLDIIKYHGNSSINHLSSDNVINGSTVNNQFQMYLWEGFQSYPYSYLFRTAGTDVLTLKYPVIFDKLHGYRFQLSQNAFTYSWEKVVSLSFPVRDSFVRSFNISKSLATNLELFVEWTDTWDPFRQIGVPTDSYGMPYDIPVGMASITSFAGFPVFIGTPHGYGNELWGGLEYGTVAGYDSNQYAQWSFINYDSVTGKALRSAFRQQIHMRVEQGPFFPNAFSSQQRCVSPTNTYLDSSGYGCFAYVPLIWIEDAQAMDVEVYFRLNDHFYTRPNRAYTLLLIGSIVGTVVFFVGLCVFLAEFYRRKKFFMRVYVD